MWPGAGLLLPECFNFEPVSLIFDPGCVYNGDRGYKLKGRGYGMKQVLGNDVEDLGKVNCGGALGSEGKGENVKVCVAYLLCSSSSGPPRLAGCFGEDEGPCGGRE